MYNYTELAFPDRLRAQSSTRLHNSDTSHYVQALSGRPSSDQLAINLRVRTESLRFSDLLE